MNCKQNFSTTLWTLCGKQFWCIHDITVCVFLFYLGGQSVRVVLRVFRGHDCVGALQESRLHHPQTHPIYASDSQSRRKRERVCEWAVDHMHFLGSDLSVKSTARIGLHSWPLHPSTGSLPDITEQCYPPEVLRRCCSGRAQLWFIWNWYTGLLFSIFSYFLRGILYIFFVMMNFCSNIIISNVLFNCI